MPPLPFLRFDAAAAAALFAHHPAAGAAGAAGAGAHASLSAHSSPSASAASFPPCGLLTAAGAGAVRRPAGSLSKHGSLARLSWTATWLGLHSLALFAHSDAASAPGLGLRQIHARPAAAEYAQGAGGLRVLAPRLGPGDFSAHHSLALGARAAALVLLQGALAAAGSSLAPDKAAHAFGFACDGPGRGGSCDTSAWDAAYLGCFWVLNAAAWALFYGHWRSAAPAPHFRRGSLLGWFRDYLWYPSSALVRGYGAAGVAEGAAAAWAFLLAHLAWAAAFMFLISWRGYWQEVIEILAYAHLLTPAVGGLLKLGLRPTGATRQRALASGRPAWGGALAPAALSIAQARLAGLAHFSAGAPGTYFSFAAPSA